MPQQHQRAPGRRKWYRSSPSTTWEQASKVIHFTAIVSSKRVRSTRVEYPCLRSTGMNVAIDSIRSSGYRVEFMFESTFVCGGACVGT